MKSNVFVHGSYYNKNYGDYLLIKRVSEEVGIDNVKLPFASNSVLSEFNGIIKKVKFRDYLKVKNCIFGGGGYLGEPPHSVTKWSLNFIRRHFFPFVVMKAFNIEVNIIGAGFGPISAPFLKPLVRFMLKNSNSVFLRDRESIKYAQNIYPERDYELVTDLAQDINFLKKIASESTFKIPFENYIAIHVGSVVSDNLEKEIINSLVALNRQGYKIVFFSDSPGHNDNLAKEQYTYNKLLEEPNFAGAISKIIYENAEDVTKVIENAQGVITGKLHVGIVASTLGIPVLSTPLHHKTVRYYRDIDNSSSCILETSETNADTLKKVSSFFNKVQIGSRKSLNLDVIERHKKAMKLVREIR